MTRREALEKFGSVRRALHRLAIQKLKPIGLGVKQALIIHVVKMKGECSMTELALTSDSDLAAVSRNIASLCKSGWLVRSAHAKDGRQSVIRLGAKAKRRLPDLDRIGDEMAELFQAPITKAEMDQLLKILTKLDDALLEISRPKAD